MTRHDLDGSGLRVKRIRGFTYRVRDFEVTREMKRTGRGMNSDPSWRRFRRCSDRFGFDVHRKCLAWEKKNNS